MSSDFLFWMNCIPASQENLQMELLKIEFSHLSKLLGNENGAGSRNSGIWFLKGIRKGCVPPCWYGFQAEFQSAEWVDDAAPNSLESWVGNIRIQLWITAVQTGLTKRMLGILKGRLWELVLKWQTPEEARYENTVSLCWGKGALRKLLPGLLLVDGQGCLLEPGLGCQDTVWIAFAFHAVSCNSKSLLGTAVGWALECCPCSSCLGFGRRCLYLASFCLP